MSGGGLVDNIDVTCWVNIFHSVLTTNGYSYWLLSNPDNHVNDLMGLVESSL